MTLIKAYGRNGKIFSVWRVSPSEGTFAPHKGDREVGRFEARPQGRINLLDWKAMNILRGHQPLIDAIIAHLTPEGESDERMWTKIDRMV